MKLIEHLGIKNALFSRKIRVKAATILRPHRDHSATIVKVRVQNGVKKCVVTDCLIAS